ncbi:putative glycosyl transferase, family 1 [groundwater metagenome]|uniref:Putative glycosyl transferase, family 1 n=1 Tax=groundwater metagenome TaxID=717931 RepID=A0A098EDD8_9ZZZZ
MKIAIVYDIVYPWIKGGGSKRYWEIAKRLADRGHDVHLYGMKLWGGEHIFIKEGVYLHGICKPYELYTPAGRRYIKHSIYFAYKLLYSLLKADFDIIDCGGTSEPPWFSVKIVSLIKMKPMVINWYEVWGDYWYTYLGKIGGFIAKTIEKITTKFPTFIISNSKNTEKRLIEIGVDKRKSKVIYNGLDIELIKSIQPAKKKFDVVFVGRLINYKQVDVVIEYIKVIKKDFKDVTCCIIGDGPEKNNLIYLSEKLDLTENIVFCGRIERDEDVWSIMKSSKVFIYPLTKEGTPFTLLEANACGVPVIGIKHRLSGVEELITDGLNGFLLERPNAELVSEKTILLLKDHTLRKKMSEEAIKFAQNFDWDNKIDEIEEIYFKLTNKSNS